MTSRLFTVAADLADQLSREPPGRLRRVAAAAAGFAVERVGLADPRLEVTLAGLRDGVPAVPTEHADVVAMAEELDEAAWDMQDLAEAGLVSEHAYLAAFARARAAASVVSAVDPDPLQAGVESVYEAHAATGDLEAVRQVVTAALAGEEQDSHVDFGCGFCADDQNRLFGHVIQVASDRARQMILLQCPQCGAFYENTPRGDDKTRRLSADEVDHLYPDH